MDNQPHLSELVTPGARQTRRRDGFLFIGALVTAVSVSLGIFYLFINALTAVNLSPWTIARNIMLLPEAFPARKMLSAEWKLDEYMTYAFCFFFNQIITWLSYLLVFIFLACGLIPIYGFVLIIMYLPWTLYFKSRMAGGSMPPPSV